jgi:glycosyltransferase involved in cell wall biosynthesis
MTVGTAIIKPAFSKISSAPTKLAEYLGCGVPCLGNSGVGDVARILEENRVGVSLTGFDEEERRRAITELLALVESPDLAKRCRETALRLFSLEGGVGAYRDIYRALLDLGSPEGRSI